MRMSDILCIAVVGIMGPKWTAITESHRPALVGRSIISTTRDAGSISVATGDCKFGERSAPGAASAIIPNSMALAGAHPCPLQVEAWQALDDGDVDPPTRDGLTLTGRGDCRWRISLIWEGATPNRRMGIGVADRTGSFVLPGGVCGGTQLGLGGSGLQLFVQGSTGSSGSGTISRNSGGDLCRKYLQMIVVDGNPCTTSNVITFDW